MLWYFMQGFPKMIGYWNFHVIHYHFWQQAQENETCVLVLTNISALWQWQSNFESFRLKQLPLKQFECLL